MRIFRLNVEVRDLAEAADFYGTLLGVEARLQAGHRCYVTAGEVTLQIVQTAEPQLLPKALYFVVDDLGPVHGRARDLGCLSKEMVHGTPAGEPTVRPWGENSFYADDPSGNPLCFVQAGTIYAG